MAVPGLVDMFSESLIAAEYFLRPAFPALRLDHTPQNVSEPARAGSLAHERENRLVDLWGADLYADLVRLNQFDLELYQRARSEIRRRLFLVPGLDDRMVHFEARCAGLATPGAETKESLQTQAF
jgi:hypothetical protein